MNPTHGRSAHLHDMIISPQYGHPVPQPTDALFDVKASNDTVPISASQVGREVGTSIELFAGGGLAQGMHRAGFRHLLINEVAKRACETLRLNGAKDWKSGNRVPETLNSPACGDCAGARRESGRIRPGSGGSSADA